MCITELNIDVSVITPTYNRPDQLLNTCHAFKNQFLDGIHAEHIIVHDGHSPQSEKIARHFKAQYFEIQRNPLTIGSDARNLGQQKAHGKYFIFWDDDNMYETHNISSLMYTTWGYDIGICKIIHENKIIPTQQEKITWGDIDTACICVKSELAKNTGWAHGIGKGEDFRFITQLKNVFNAKINYSPIIVAKHIASNQKFDSTVSLPNLY
jgi:glycosyltransferase involved in cell wall biosynthesis